jgi:hypothetical protein
MGPAPPEPPLPLDVLDEPPLPVAGAPPAPDVVVPEVAEPVVVGPLVVPLAVVEGPLPVVDVAPLDVAPVLDDAAPPAPEPDALPRESPDSEAHPATSASPISVRSERRTIPMTKTFPASSVGPTSTAT